MTSAFAEPPDTSTITIRRAAGTVVVRPAPRREPPFDDEIADGQWAVRPYDRPLPFQRAPRLRLQAPPNVLRGALPDPALWGRRLLVGIIEAAAGRRPLNQLGALLSRSVATGLRGDFARAAGLGRRHWTHAATVHSVHASEPTENVAELAATVRQDDRVRAIAIRLEVRHGRWCCTRLMVG